MNIAYKIVYRLLENRFFSYNINTSKVINNKWEDNPFILEYIPNQETRPKLKNSKLFSFGDLESAKDFLEFDHDKRLEIWTCEVDEFNPITITVPSDYNQKFEYWKNQDIHFKGLGLFKNVESCVLSNTIKLLERVEFREKKV